MSEGPDTSSVDWAVQRVRDAFTITTKALDQFSRTGSHHIIRRQLAMTDTSLFTQENNRDIPDLPLFGNGVFSEKLVNSQVREGNKENSC